MIPTLDVSALFGDDGPERVATDQAIAAAAATSGFLSITASLEFMPTDVRTHRELLRIFELPAAEQRELWRNFYDSTHANVYRGWSPRSADVPVDIFDMGPDVAHGKARVDGDTDEVDPLLGFTPVPTPQSLPGWHDAVQEYYRAMEHVGAMLMRSIARSLGLEQTFFDSAFTGGISTLRLLRYEASSANPDTPDVDDPELPRRGEHVDSGFLTLLCQHGVGGLAAKMPDGHWIDVPAVDGQVVVNFGGVLERWTGGRIRATPHRVVSHGGTRYSIPFFFEPRVNAVISPLPQPGAAQFESFAYGDHLWAAMSKFPNFVGIAGLRTPRGLPGADAAR